MVNPGADFYLTKPCHITVSYGWALGIPCYLVKELHFYSQFWDMVVVFLFEALNIF